VSALVELAADLRTALLRTGYHPDALLQVLGSDAHDALGRSEPVPARRAARSAGEIGTLIRLFLLGDALPEAEVAAALHPVEVDRAVAAGLLDRDGDALRPGLDLRPVDTGGGTRWILSDLDDNVRRRALPADHVLGVGQASLSLLRATPTSAAGTVLDLGTGCGIQAVHATSYGDKVTATDVLPRAIGLAEATAALNELDIEFLTGSWFDPVAHRRFDRIVANPPFVVGSGSVTHTYRDSGLALDGASRLVIEGVPGLLAPGGLATLLASWVHIEGEDWRARVSSWLPDYGVQAWILQRDVADPALYVGTWQRDAGQDPRDESTQRQAEQWLDTFAEANVEGIGFGFVYLRNIDGPTEVLAEDLRHEFSDPLGEEAVRHFERTEWLRTADLPASRFSVAAATALERVYQVGDEGWQQLVARIHRGDGPRWQHEIDDATASLLAGMRADGLALEELVALLAFASGDDEPTPELTAAATNSVRALVLHGLIDPA
jgi:methylase of polypeptide subunit release factors